MIIIRLFAPVRKRHTFLSFLKRFVNLIKWGAKYKRNYTIVIIHRNRRKKNKHLGIYIKDRATYQQAAISIVINLTNYNCGPDAIRLLHRRYRSIAQILIYFAAGLLAFSVHSFTSAYTYRGSRGIPSETLFNAFGTVRFNTGRVTFFCVFDRTINDSIDNSTCILDRNTLACSVPSGVNQMAFAPCSCILDQVS